MLNRSPNSHFCPGCDEQAQNWFWNLFRIKSPQQANLWKLSRNAVVWYENITTYAIEARILLHGETASNVKLARSFLLRMIPTTWWILYKISFACGFLIVVNIGLKEEYLSNGMEFLLNSEPLSKITLRGLGYLESHTLLNIKYILAVYWSKIGTSEIKNHPISGSIKVVHNSCIYSESILLSVCLTLVTMVYVPMKSTHTILHGVKVSA